MCHSYKGGSGKTLFVTNIAQILAEVYRKRVLVIEADFDMPSLTSVYQKTNPSLFFNDYLKEDELDLASYIYPISQNQGVIFCSNRFRISDREFSNDTKWYLGKFEQIRQNLELIDYDFVLIDLSPGFHLFTVNALMLTDDVLLLMRPDFHSYEGTKLLLDYMYAKSVRHVSIKTHLIINQISPYYKMREEVERWRIFFEENYQFIDKTYLFEYDEITAYHTAIKRIVLPNDDPTYERICSFIEEFNLVTNQA